MTVQEYDRMLIEEGIQQGRQEGMQQGIQQGRQEERQNTVAFLMQEFNLSEEEVLELLERFYASYTPQDV